MIFLNLFYSIYIYAASVQEGFLKNQAILYVFFRLTDVWSISTRVFRHWSYRNCSAALIGINSLKSPVYYAAFSNMQC